MSETSELVIFHNLTNFQVNPEKYRGIVSGFRVTVAEEGFRALAKVLTKIALQIPGNVQKKL